MVSSFFAIAFIFFQVGDYSIEASKVNEGIVIDGKLNDTDWIQAQVLSGFTQFSPNPGQPATERTEVRVLYDNNYLYVGMRIYESVPQNIIRRMGRRDDHNLLSDWVVVYIDSNLDKRSAYGFFVNPYGVKKDILIVNDTGVDRNWIGIWGAKASMDSLGWNVEYKIPFSQLRIRATSAGIHELGINFAREIARNNEITYWIPIHPDDNSFVSSFSLLTDLHLESNQIGLEVMPYLTSNIEIDSDANLNPLITSPQYNFKTGIDINYGLSQSITLTATLNPDFGQVEVDPAIVNLSAFETFLPDQRPFFTEGSNLFHFGDTPNVLQYQRLLRVPGNEGLLYTRRIGRVPQGDISGVQYQNIPTSTRILGAAKLSGRMPNGWSVGIMNALTERMKGEVLYQNGTIENISVEPLTNYTVARVSRDFKEGMSAIGMIATATHRERLGGTLESLSDEAYSLGLDGRHSFLNRNYEVAGWLAGSYVSGSQVAIQLLQRAPGRYYQRPNATHLSFDANKTSISGVAGSIAVAKRGGDHWRSGIQYETRSPGFETNDIGYLRDTDWHFLGTWLGYIDYPATKKVQKWTLFGNAFNRWSWGSERLESGMNVNADVIFNNNWSTSLGIEHYINGFNVDALRGGPGVATDPFTILWFNLASDRTKTFSSVLSLRQEIEHKTKSSSTNVSINLATQLTSWFSISTRPSIRWGNNSWQWVWQQNLNNGEVEYLVGNLDHTTFSINFRVSISPIPDLSLDLFIQPLVNKANYSDYRYLSDPEAKDFENRFTLFRSDQIETSGVDASGREQFAVYEENGNTIRYTFSDPSFSLRSLRANAVLRWEIRPGTELYLVWQQRRWGQLTGFYNRSITSLLPELTSDPFQNVFLVKATYWLGK